MKRVFKCSLFSILLVFLLSACSSNLNVSVNGEIEAEYGKEIDTATLYDKEQSDEDIEVKEIKDYDSKKLGEQEITVVFVNGDEKTVEEKVKVNVKDTAYPIVTLKKDSVEITEGDKFNPASNIESVKDPIDGDIKKSDDSKITKNGYVITTDVNNKKAGAYKVKVTAFDMNGNNTEKTYKVTVKAKPEAKPQTSTYQQASSGGQATSVPATSQSSGSTGGNSTSKPQSQPSSQPSQPATSVPTGNGVYIAGSGNGTKYHSSPYCSNMNNPIAISLDDAMAQGYTPCKKCH